MQSQIHIYWLINQHTSHFFSPNSQFPFQRPLLLCEPQKLLNRIGGCGMGEQKLKHASSSPSFRLRCPSLNSLRLRRIFDLFDKNGDSMITVDEISQALNLMGLEAEVLELESMIRWIFLLQYFLLYYNYYNYNYNNLI